MNVNRISISALCVVVALLPQTMSAQMVEIPDAPSCASCRINVQDVLRLDAKGVLPTAPTSVVRDARGRFWLTFDNQSAMIFAADGRYIRELKKGQGPGEFEYPWAIIPIGDSVLVQDRSRGATVLGPDLAPVRSLPPARMQGRMIPLKWPDSTFVNARRYDTPGDMNPFHIASFAGKDIRVARSFGADPDAKAPDPRRMPSMSRQIAAAGPTGFWASPYNRYAIQQWTFAGALRQTITRKTPWFPENPPQMDFKSAPPPQIRALQQDAKGLLWVLVSVAAPTWREGYPKLGPGVSEVGPEAFQYEKLYRTTIEVIDPVAHRVVARRALDNWVVALMPDGTAAIYDADKDGEPFVRIVRLTLSR